ncbi:MAG: leucyl/phenylalanyl-tRNA--protein transferase [Deltaproteobacteria bacterium]|nr:MAG: leucyl/phenylalanyl-tRNA--protein transferase [Deltaproteobacteria bacterium]
MPVYRLSQAIAFPDPEEADPSGLLAVGGDLSPERLLAAYSLGIFPWYSEGLPILWHAPDPRFVLPLSALRVSRSLRKSMRRYESTFDTAFREVIAACASVPRRGQAGTWITAEMKDAYVRLHELGFAHSVETWHEGELVGGLYGVSLGGAFFGESMFHRARDASKVALVRLVEQLRRWDFDFVDCQVPTAHLASLGAEAWPRARFQRALERALEKPTRRGRWGLRP